jgi:DNA gyrase subunit A
LNGYGKRTLFGPNSAAPQGEPEAGEGEDVSETVAETPSEAPIEESGDEDEVSSSNRYRTQRRGGKGLRDIKTTERNGPVIGVTGVRDDDEILMMTARGKLQRIVVGEIGVIGRNTQGVRIMSLDEGDTLAALVRVPRDEDGNGSAFAKPAGAPDSASTTEPPPAAGESPPTNSEE